MLILFIALASLLGFSSTQGEKPFLVTVEMGALDANGGSHSDAYNAKIQTSLDLAKHHAELGGHFLRTQANDIESNRSWDANVRYRYELSHYWSAYTGHLGESDIYNGYTQRDSDDLGAQYLLQHEDDFLWIAEAGYRYSKTLPQQSANRFENYGRLYTRAEKVFFKDWIFEIDFEYLPNFTHSENYLVNGSASVTTILNKTFAIKLTTSGQYQHSPYLGTRDLASISSMNLVTQF